nr:hypothetical protein [Tanacetum cinerariifolium]
MVIDSWDSFQLDEQWFTLDADLLRKALEITPEDATHPFVTPPAGEAVMYFVNELGYPKESHFVSKMHFWNTLTQEAKSSVYSFQLDEQWFTLDADLLCKALEITPEDATHPFVTPPAGEAVMYFVNELGYPKESHFVSKMHVNLNTTTKKSTPHVIPYCQFTKLIVYYLESRHNIHRRPESPIHVTCDDFPLGDLKFVPKGKVSKIRKENSSFKLIQEEEDQQAPEPHVDDDEYNLQRETTRKLLEFEGKGKGIATDEQAALSLLDLHNPKKRSTTDQYVLQRQTPITHDEPTGPSAQLQDDTSEKMFQETSSPADSTNVAEKEADTKRTDSDTGTEVLNIDEEQDEPGKPRVDIEVESMVIVPIHQVVSSVPPLSTPVIDILPPKPSSHHVHEQLITATTETITTRLLPQLPQQQQCTTDSELAFCVSALEQIFNEVVKEAVQTVLQAPLRECFKDLSKSDIKEILHQRMFESGSHKVHHDHESLYHALEMLMDHDNQEALYETLTTSQPQAQTSSTWKTSNIRKAPSSSSKQKTAPQSEKPVDDILIPDGVHILNSEDTSAAHLLKIKTRPDWLKPVLKEERLETPEPDWVIPPNDLHELENNWAIALAKTYKDPKEQKLL